MITHLKLVQTPKGRVLHIKKEKDEYTDEDDLILWDAYDIDRDELIIKDIVSPKSISLNPGTKIFQQSASGSYQLKR